MPWASFSMLDGPGGTDWQMAVRYNNESTFKIVEVQWIDPATSWLEIRHDNHSVSEMVILATTAIYYS